VIFIFVMMLQNLLNWTQIKIWNFIVLNLSYIRLN
jgi:hypothetical protein